MSKGNMLGTLVASLRRAPPLLHAWPRALSLLSQQRAYVSVTQARMKIFGWWEPEGAASTPFNGLNRLRRRGWIGEKVYKLLIEKGHSVIIGNARAENRESLEEEIVGIQPTNIISTIGRTHGKIGDKEYTTIDYLEQPGKIKENVRDNLFSPIAIALLSKKYNIHYAYLGTGCIFTYDSEHPFAEELNGFFGSKADFEKYILKNRIDEIAYDKRYTYLVRADYDAQLPYYFNNNYNFICEYLKGHVHHPTNGLFEKSEIRWFTVNDLKREKNIFRY